MSAWSGWTPGATAPGCSRPATARAPIRACGTTCPTARSRTRPPSRAGSTGMAAARDPVFYALVDPGDGRPRGMASYLRIAPEHGSIEIGHIWFGAGLQRTTAATEAIFLLAARAFDGLGNRRLEWKCDAANARSRRAAERFGFTFEGVFRQHMVVKGRNRDSAWYSMLDGEWPAVRAAFERWLDPANFDAAGVQRTALDARRRADASQRRRRRACRRHVVACAALHVEGAAHGGQEVARARPPGIGEAELAARRQQAREQAQRRLDVRARVEHVRGQHDVPRAAGGERVAVPRPVHVRDVGRHLVEREPVGGEGDGVRGAVRGQHLRARPGGDQAGQGEAAAQLEHARAGAQRPLGERARPARVRCATAAPTTARPGRPRPPPRAAPPSRPGARRRRRRPGAPPAARRCPAAARAARRPARRAGSPAARRATTGARAGGPP